MSAATERTLGGLQRTSLPELLEWHSTASGDLPDADMTVLMWIVIGSESDWEAGWWDGEAWRLCESGGLVDGAVTHWAEPAGPTC